MEEDEYRATYNEIATVRCVFEKALTNNQCKCSFSEHFCLADREGYSCKSSESADICSKFLEKLRKSSRFLLKSQDLDAPMPHNMEIRVQAGGVKGLQRVLDKDSDETPDIMHLLTQAKKTFGTLNELPYSSIMQFVAQFKGRKRGKKAPL